MADNTGGDVYAKLGVRRVINAGGNTTRWGGSTPSPVVKRAMQEADGNWVEMRELLEKSGEYIAGVLGVEAAYVTAGCYAALVLSTAACVAGKDREKGERLPDTGGMKDEIVIQKPQRYGFDRCFTAPGSRLVEAGDGEGCTPEQLAGAIGPATAAVAYFVMPDWGDNVVPLKDAVRIAHERGVPVIADAASRVYPLDLFRKTAQSADLVCFGGKYIDAPQSTGLLCGRRDLVAAAATHGFLAPRPFGRGMKLDRQEVVGIVAALDAWFSMDHEARLSGYDAKFSAIRQALRGVPNVLETAVVRTPRPPGVTLHVVFDSRTLGKRAQQVVDDLYAGDPRIRVLREGDDTLNVNVHTLNEGEEHALIEGLQRALSGARQEVGDGV